MKEAEQYVRNMLGGDKCCPGKVIDFKMPKDEKTMNDAELVAQRLSLIESIRKAELAVRESMGGLCCIAGIQVEHVLNEGIRYVGELTMVGNDDSLYGQTIVGPDVKIDPELKAGKPIDSRRELAEMLRELANALYEHIEEHP